MALLNGAAALAFYWLLPVGDGEVHLGNTLFFLFLLTLLVVLYDRYRPHYVARHG
jgi:hypothetical protein